VLGFLLLLAREPPRSHLLRRSAARAASGTAGVLRGSGARLSGTVGRAGAPRRRRPQRRAREAPGLGAQL
jgi:hypothetical protein